MSRRSKACEFSSTARTAIKERDRGCIFCQMGYHMPDVPQYGQQIFGIMHYIPRSAGGLGIVQNGAVGCEYHHSMLDNGKEGLRPEMLDIFMAYLQEKNPGWDEKALKYTKNPQ